MKHITIIGGGIIGLCAAYYLRKSGHAVTIIDQGDLTVGCSTGNAGMIVPSHVVPLAAPGMISKGIRWMFKASSPFYVKPRVSGALLRWGYLFFRNANQGHVEKAAHALKDISLLSKLCYQQLAKELPFDFGYHERGLFMLYQTEKSEKEETETANLANRFGIEARILDCAGVQKLETQVKVTVRGGVYFPGDAHLDPEMLTSNLLGELDRIGVDIRRNVTVTGFIVEGSEVKALSTTAGGFEVESLVVAAGSWSGLLARKLGLLLPMQAGKGYSFTLNGMNRNVTVPSLLIDERVAVTPFGDRLRFGGTMEITGINHDVYMSRVKGIVDAIPKYYPEIRPGIPEVDKVWHGLRPCSPDGLPYIGRLSKQSNVVMATGHAMMGLSLAAGTGLLVEEIVGDKKPSIDLGMFNPERFN